MIRRPPRSTLFPYPTLFRSRELENQVYRLALFASGDSLTLKDAQGDVEFFRVRLSPEANRDRKSTRLNSSHLVISYAVFCLKKKKNFSEPQYGPCKSRLNSQ